MRSLSERQFHVLMGVLVLASTFVDPLMESLTGAWRPPNVSFVTLVLGLVWVALFAGYRGRNLDDQVRVLKDRLDRAERRVDVLDAEAAERRRPLM